MFLVGATGQLLTLILTVCLPLVFLVSGHQKLETQSPVTYFSVHQTHQEISSIENNIFKKTTDFVIENNNHQFEFDDGFTNQKFPYEKFLDNWKSNYSKSSGNKAPPVFPFFSC